MRSFIYLFLISLIFTSCTGTDDPKERVSWLLSSISNGTGNTRSITYDASGRVIEYQETYPEETVVCSYTYPSADRIKISTKHTRNGQWKEDEIIIEYDDEMILDKGLALSCDGVFTRYEGGKLSMQKKYQHKFDYSAGNNLESVLCTEWRKSGDNWISPISWENKYIWEDQNISRIEEYSAKSVPDYICEYSYSKTSGIQNIVRIHFGRYQYYPLQLNGILGTQPNNLIIGVSSSSYGVSNPHTEFEYNIEDGRISSYIESRNGVSDTYFVRWVK